MFNTGWALASLLEKHREGKVGEKKFLYRLLSLRCSFWILLGSPYSSGSVVQHKIVCDCRWVYGSGLGLNQLQYQVQFNWYPGFSLRDYQHRWPIASLHPLNPFFPEGGGCDQGTCDGSVQAKLAVWCCLLSVHLPLLASAWQRGCWFPLPVVSVAIPSVWWSTCKRIQTIFYRRAGELIRMFKAQFLKQFCIQAFPLGIRMK